MKSCKYEATQKQLQIYFQPRGKKERKKNNFPSDFVSANGDSSHRNLMLCRLELLLLSFVAIFQKPEINQLNAAVSGGTNGNECKIEQRRGAEKIEFF